MCLNNFLFSATLPCTVLRFQSVQRDASSYLGILHGITLFQKKKNLSGGVSQAGKEEIS